MNDILLFFSWKYEGDWYRIFKAIEEKEKVDYKELARIKNCIKDNYLTILDKNYPIGLRNVTNPPFVLYYRGDVTLLNKRGIAFIGCRKNSEYGEIMINKLIKPIGRKYTIVSGLAKGIDGLSHKYCLENEIKTIAVLGNGLDYYYPSVNKELQNLIKEKGLLISEYPSFVRPKKHHFPMRNRIIAGLSKAIVVIECKRQSGSMISVEHGLNLGLDIFCVPSRANEDSGCNYLIKNGAKLVECASDIIEDL